MKKNFFKGMSLAVFCSIVILFSGCNFFTNLLNGNAADVKGVWEVIYFNNENYPKKLGPALNHLYLYFSDDGKVYSAIKVTGSPDDDQNGLFKNEALTSDYTVSDLGLNTKFTQNLPVPCTVEEGKLKLVLAGKPFLEAKSVTSPSGEDIKNAKSKI